MVLQAEPVGSRWYVPASILKRVVLLTSSRRYVGAEIFRTGAADVGGRGVLYLGEGESLEYLAAVCGSETPEPQETTLRTVLAGARRRNADQTVLVELNRLLSPLVPSGGYRTLPWIRQKVDLRPGAASRSDTGVERVYGRRVRRHGYRWQITTSPRDGDSFYRDQYRPYIEGRYRSGAHLRSRDEIRRAMDRGFLLQVLDGDRWVSSVACCLGGREVTALAFGLAEPHDDLLRCGALSATTYFLLRWARENRLRSVDLLRSRPHAADGVYEHKRRFGARPVVDDWPHTAIWVFPASAARLWPPLAGLLVQAGSGFRPLASCIERAAPEVGSGG